MRFYDSLDTVLAAEMSGPAAVEWTWRQVVDLIGRRRADPRPDAIERLRAIRSDVSVQVRAATARGLERAQPPAALVALFVDEDLAIAAPVVRSAQLSDGEWIALLPQMRSATRGILRLRRDLTAEVAAALAAFGPTDFALADDAAPTAAAIGPVEDFPVADGPVDAEPAAAFVPPLPDPFVKMADVARELPIVAEALRLETREPASPATGAGDDFAIASLVARIEARQRDGGLAADDAPTPVESFRFETDSRGLIRWVDWLERSALIGLSLTAGRDGGPVSVDGVAAGALARRARFSDARLEVTGNSAAAGSWRISGVPAFDRASGRFTGYRGTARRPRIDEAPETASPSGAAGDALRQLVHELRTPANAISGFAEMIEHQLLGPVAPAYRERAAAIRVRTVGLLEAIDDLDTAARLDAGRLELRAEPVEMTALLTRVVDLLAPLAEARAIELRFDVPHDAVVVGDARALERAVSRFLVAVVASAAGDGVVRGGVAREGDLIALTVARPAGFAATDGALFGSDVEAEANDGSGPLLGTEFAFRLARRLATELGGSLTVTAATLTLRLPAAVAAK